MYCWIIATPFEGQERLLIHAGTDEEEAVRIAKDRAPHYRKVVAKAISGVLLYRQVNPIVEYASYFTVGFDDDHYGGHIPKKEIYDGHDREQAIAAARAHAGEFDLVGARARGEYGEGFDSREPIISISRSNPGS
ncbi:MAG: hypothetical protein ACREXY_05045 [Gammaproteobacteria bacterium]